MDSNRGPLIIYKHHTVKKFQIASETSIFKKKIKNCEFEFLCQKWMNYDDSDALILNRPQKFSFINNFEGFFSNIEFLDIKERFLTVCKLE